MEIERFQTLEMVFDQAIISPANPFDTYLLRLEVTDPNGRTVPVPEPASAAMIGVAAAVLFLRCRTKQSQLEREI